MNFGAIKYYDVANGPGVRVNVFVSGCTHRCADCFNENTWAFDYGEKFTEDHLQGILNAMEPSYIAGITFLGGEPMEPANRSEVFHIADAVQEKYPEKSIWCYSGYLAEELLAASGLWSPSLVPGADDVPRNRVMSVSPLPPDSAAMAHFLSQLDVLVDGEFQKERRNLMLKFRGSENQRLIDMKKTLSENKIVLWGK